MSGVKRHGYLLSVWVLWTLPVVVTVVCQGGVVGLSIQCSRLRVKAMAARVCPWCFRVRVSGFEIGG